MFKKFVLAASFIALITGSISASAAVEQSQDDEHVMPAGDNRPIPWPWMLAQPFPWTDIQGLWKVEEGDFTSYFALKVVRHKTTGLRQLQVKQFDGETCRLLANGVGVERNQKVLAQMTSKGGAIYRVQLTAFSEKDSPLPPLKGKFPMESVMVLSMGSLGDIGPENMISMQIMKVSSYITQRMCFEDTRK